MSVSVAVKNVARSCGEGPFWEESTKTLFSVDAFVNEVIRWNTVTNKVDRVAFDEICTIILPRKKGGYITTQANRVVHFDWDNHRAHTDVSVVGMGKKTRFNDGKCDKTGRLWAGTNGENAELQGDVGTLYAFSKSRESSPHVDKITVSNGMTWTLDWKRMFYIDSHPRRVWEFDFDVKTGTVSNKRLFLQFTPDNLKKYGYPDGMTTDAEGKLWIACWDGGKVIRIDPDTAKIIQEIELPARKITSLCFGGDDYEDMYVTSDRTPLSEEEFKKDPLAGSIFKVTGLGIRGLPQYAYEG